MKTIKNKKIKNLKKAIMLILVSTFNLNAQDNSISFLEETLIDMGSSLDLDLISEAQDLRELEALPYQQEDEYLYEEYLQSTLEWQESQESTSIDLPPVDELVSIAENYQYHYF